MAAFLSADASRLQDWNTGTIPFYTMPPAQAASDKATIVTQFSQAFDLDSLVQDDAMLLDQLPSNTGDFITMVCGGVAVGFVMLYQCTNVPCIK
jgi:hypothetical protein